MNQETITSLTNDFYTAPSKEARAKVVAANQATFQELGGLNREFDRASMPAYARATGRASENKYYDKVRLVKDGILTGMAVTVAVKGAWWVKNWIF